MGIDLGSLSGGLAQIQATLDSISTDPTFATLTVTGATDLQSTVTMSALPSSDPTVAGELWSDTNVVTVSAGA